MSQTEFLILPPNLLLPELSASQLVVTPSFWPLEPRALQSSLTYLPSHHHRIHKQLLSVLPSQHTQIWPLPPTVLLQANGTICQRYHCSLFQTGLPTSCLASPQSALSKATTGRCCQHRGHVTPLFKPPVTSTSFGSKAKVHTRSYKVLNGPNPSCLFEAPTTVSQSCWLPGRFSNMLSTSHSPPSGLLNCQGALSDPFCDYTHPSSDPFLPYLPTFHSRIIYCLSLPLECKLQEDRGFCPTCAQLKPHCLGTTPSTQQSFSKHLQDKRFVINPSLN